MPDTAAESPPLPPLPSPERLQELTFDAARLGRDDVLTALLRAGVPIEARDSRGYSALILASYNCHKSTTALLLDEGAAVDGADGARGNTALMGVAFKGYGAIARLLLDRGADPDQRNRSGQTALMMAALFGQRDIVSMLLAAGADAAITDKVGNSANSVARAQGNETMLALLEGRMPD